MPVTSARTTVAVDGAAPPTATGSSLQVEFTAVGDLVSANRSVRHAVSAESDFAGVSAAKVLTQFGHDVTVFSGPPYPELDDARLVAGRATDRATGPASRQTSSTKRAGATASIEPTNPGRLRLEKLASLDLYNDDDPFRHPHPRELRDRIDVVEYAGMLSGSFPEPRTFGMRLAREMRSRSREFDVLHDNQTLAPGLLDIARGGLPVVTTRCGTNDEAVQPPNRLVEDSAEALADSLLHFLRDPGLRADVGRANRQHALTHHDLPTQCVAMGQAFAEVESLHRA